MVNYYKLQTVADRKLRTPVLLQVIHGRTAWVEV